MNKNKIAEPDRIENEVLKRGTASLTQPLTELFNMTKVMIDIPEQW